MKSRGSFHDTPQILSNTDLNEIISALPNAFGTDGRMLIILQLTDARASGEPISGGADEGLSSCAARSASIRPFRLDRPKDAATSQCVLGTEDEGTEYMPRILVH